MFLLSSVTVQIDFYVMFKEGTVSLVWVRWKIKNRILSQITEASQCLSPIFSPWKHRHKSVVFQVLESQFPCKYLKSLTLSNTHIVVVAFTIFSILD